MRKNKTFNCTSTALDITNAIRQYEEDAFERHKETDAFKCGCSIQAGLRTVAQLLPIARWKSPRRKGLIASNDPAVVGEILGVACSAAHERTALAVLCGLSGVGVPMASAILTAIDQVRYTVIDRRVLNVLTGNEWDPTVDDYVRYLEFCKGRAKAYGVSLRNLDRALWTLGA